MLIRVFHLLLREEEEKQSFADWQQFPDKSGSCSVVSYEKTLQDVTQLMADEDSS